MRTYLSFMVFAFMTLPAWAAPTTGGTTKAAAPSSPSGGGHGVPGTLYADAFLYWGSTNGTVQGQSEKLSLNQQGAGFTIGPMFNETFLALGTDYRMVNNSKAPDSQIGSFKGTRWAPLLLAAGYCAESFLIKFEYEPFGLFHLTQPTYQGGSITYGGGGGFRAQFLWQVYGGLMMGPHYESLKFSSRFDSQNGQAGSQALTLTQVGLTGSYVF